MVLEATDVAAALAAAPDVEGACGALADVLVHHGFALPSVYLLRGGRLRCHAARGYWQIIDGFAPGVGVIGDVLVSGQPAFVPDVRQRDDFIAAIPGLRGEASVPIWLQGQTVGVLSVESTTVLPRGSLRDLTVCAEALADRLDQLGGIPGRSPHEMLADNVLALSRLSDVAAVQELLTAAACDLSGMSTALVARRSPHGDLGVTARSGPLADRLSRMDAAQLATVAGWVEHGTSCYFAGGEASGAHEFFVRAGAGSVLVLPLTVQGSQGGVLVTADAAVVTCPTDDVQLLEQLASHGAATLQSIKTVDHLRELALTDALTGVGNSAAFDEARTDHGTASPELRVLCMVDIDHFKRINDTHGHVAGDRLLSTVAATLTRAIDGRGRVFRLGGDEFAVTVPARDTSEAAPIGALLCDAARRTGRFTLSVGVTVTRALDTAAIARADRAMYEVKRRGRDGFQVSADDGDAALDRARDAHWTVPATVAEEIHEIVFTTDATGRWTYLNQAWTQLVGVPVDQTLGTLLFDRIHPDDRPTSVAAFGDLWAGRADMLRSQWRWRTADGGVRWGEVWARPLRTPGGEVIGAVGTLSDVTARKRAEDALRTQLTLSTVITRILERFARLAPEHVDEGINHALALLGRFARVDRAHLFQFSADHRRMHKTHEWCADGVDPQIHRFKNLPVARLGDWMARLRAGHAVQVSRVADVPEDLAELRASLEEYGVRSLSIVPLLAGERLIGFLGFHATEGERGWSGQEIELLRSVANVLVSVLARHDATDRLTRQALLDPLTGLPNRATFRACVQQALDGGARPLAVLVVDIDDFTAVNHSRSPAAGDEVLAVVAERVSHALPSADVCARLAGDQFAVLCADLDHPDAAVDTARRIARTIGVPLACGDAHLYLTASIGIAYDGGARDAAQLLQDADTGMRRAKRRGRDCVEVFTEALRADIAQRMEIATDLRGAIADHRLQLAYQPIVDLRTGVAVATEALVRWDHPQRGHIAPVELIGVAEETGLVLGLGRRVLLDACGQLARWRQQGLALSMSVNLSAHQLGDEGLVDTIAEATARAGVAPGCLTLELTESSLMADTAQTMRVLRALKDLGVRLSVDDFGTGFSSLSYLKRFPVDEVKIDRSFVDGLGTDPEDTAIVTAIHSLARALGLDVVAEGVETDRQRHALADLGCGAAQGHWFSAAVPAGQLVGTISHAWPAAVHPAAVPERTPAPGER